ncbi:MAG: HDOD domain-containing protein [Rhodoferax sp.]|nr:HDOD domain-containing protein [Rhodoferax sp.]
MSSMPNRPNHSVPPNADAVLKNIVIPSCPAVLSQLRTEMAQDDPDIGKVARMVGTDVALSLAVLRTINSPYYGLRRQVDDIRQAVAMIGIRQVSMLVTSILMRQSLNSNGLKLVRFWDVSNKRSLGLAKLAKGLRGVEVHLAQSFGLFCDIGIPLLMQRFPDYGMTLKLANDAPEGVFTDVEREHHGADHAHIGAIMARSWGLADTLCLAIRHHHDYSALMDSAHPAEVARLMAFNLLVELAIQSHGDLNVGNEWNKGGEYAMSALMLSDQDVEDWVDDLAADFSAQE